jgi:hypothetical protein
VYRTYHNVDQDIKKLIIDSFEDTYLNALSDLIMGYADCMSLQLLTHLLTYYSMISPTELTQNYERLNAPYDPNEPIETFFPENSGRSSLCGSGWTALWRRNDRQCGIHIGVQHGIVPRCMSGMAIRSNFGGNVDAVQVRFCHCTS